MSTLPRRRDVRQKQTSAGTARARQLTRPPNYLVTRVSDRGAHISAERQCNAREKTSFYADGKGGCCSVGEPSTRLLID
jgi:hypothetical protein